MKIWGDEFFLIPSRKRGGGEFLFTYKLVGRGGVFSSHSSGYFSVYSEKMSALCTISLCNSGGTVLKHN